MSATTHPAFVVLALPTVNSRITAVICALSMPLTFSLAHGIVFGFITCAGIKLLAGRRREIPPAVGLIAVVVIAKFA